MSGYIGSARVNDPISIRVVDFYPTRSGVAWVFIAGITPVSKQLHVFGVVSDIRAPLYPSVGGVGITGYVPNIRASATPSVGNVVVTGATPTVS